MKKLIAMLLCVAMIAALSVNAFAASKLKTHDVEHFYNKVAGINTSDNGYTRNYAADLANAKKAAADKKSDATKTLKAIKDAVATAQNYALAETYKTMVAVVDAQVQDAITNFAVNFAYNYMKDVQDVASPTLDQVQNVIDNFEFFKMVG